MFNYKKNQDVSLQSFKFWCALLCTGTPLLLSAACSAQEDRPVSSEEPTTSTAPISQTGIYGIVTNTNGQPLSEVGVAVTHGTAPYREILMLSGDDGKYQWPLSAGRFTLKATKDGYKAQSREVEVKENEAVRLDFVLERQPKQQ